MIAEVLSVQFASQFGSVISSFLVLQRDVLLDVSRSMPQHPL